MQQFGPLGRPEYVEVAMEGAAAEFEDFVRARWTSLVRYGYVLTGNPHDAADLAQEALARLGSAWPRVVNRDNPEAYVRTAMVRLHISWWRRLRRERLMSEVPDQPAGDRAFDRIDSASELWPALARLPRRQRAVVVLRYYEHRTDDEIATLLGISRVTVRSQASRALEKLRAHCTPSKQTTSGRQG
ncbi:SigE family RNA polymerase sigma factor [Asanoa iriomotensis]|uniref:DNA-directed RNA polymerase sigma-70 factor n=1 Tax=Asanoa iriomotensis TaxID=234613 RepID=A0ABQ4C0S5_9ACTN|nr:SigE family RNA polymerase sigma factor [Asanoa iriomotensis]GIF56376.1 DNA-directed RNA polymerase sigma-70 factor [Asanoa iriomotensis]